MLGYNKVKTWKELAERGGKCWTELHGNIKYVGPIDDCIGCLVEFDEYDSLEQTEIRYGISLDKEDYNNYVGLVLYGDSEPYEFYYRIIANTKTARKLYPDSKVNKDGDLEL